MGLQDRDYYGEKYWKLIEEEDKKPPQPPRIEKIYRPNFGFRRKWNQFLKFFQIIFALISLICLIIFIANYFHTPKEKLPASISQVKNCICSDWEKRECGAGGCGKMERWEVRSCTPSNCALESRCIEDPTCCSCAEWINKGCGEGGCPSDKMWQVRNCFPSGCQEESRCIDDESCISETPKKETFSASVIKKEESTNCICDTWKNMGCGEENCSFDEMYQKRFCLPAGCNKESQCVKDEDCVHPINEEVKVGDWKWKIIKVRNRGSILRGSESNYPEWTKDKITEGKFIEVEMLIQNMGKNTLSYHYPSLYDEKKREYKTASGETYDWIPREKWCWGKDLRPNFSPIDCIEIYEVAKDSTNLWLYIPSTDWLEKGKFIYLGSF
jgi:hypothetical protein